MTQQMAKLKPVVLDPLLISQRAVSQIQTRNRKTQEIGVTVSGVLISYRIELDRVDIYLMGDPGFRIFFEEFDYDLTMVSE